MGKIILHFPRILTQHRWIFLPAVRCPKGPWTPTGGPRALPQAGQRAAASFCPRLRFSHSHHQRWTQLSDSPLIPKRGHTMHAHEPFAKNLRNSCKHNGSFFLQQIKLLWGWAEVSHINDHTSCHIKLLILYPGTSLLKVIFISFYILIKEPNPQCLQTLISLIHHRWGWGPPHASPPSPQQDTLCSACSVGYSICLSCELRFPKIRGGCF